MRTILKSLRIMDLTVYAMEIYTRHIHVIFVGFGLSFDSQHSITHIRRWLSKKEKKKADHIFAFRFYKSFSMIIFRCIIFHIYNIQDSHFLINQYPFLHDFLSWSWLLDDYFYIYNFIETAFTRPLLWNMNKVLSKSKFHSYINTLIELNVGIDARMV